MNTGTKKNQEEGFFVNLTNHPSKQWEEAELLAAQKYGTIVDIPFPDVDPDGNENYIARLAGEYIEKIISLHPSAVLCQGEFCLVYSIVSYLKQKKTTVLSACSERTVIEEKQRKQVIFRFRQFREY